VSSPTCLTPCTNLDNIQPCCCVFFLFCCFALHVMIVIHDYLTLYQSYSLSPPSMHVCIFLIYVLFFLLFVFLLLIIASIINQVLLVVVFSPPKTNAHLFNVVCHSYLLIVYYFNINNLFVLACVFSQRTNVSIELKQKIKKPRQRHFF